jgi:hypothetical protein
MGVDRVHERKRDVVKTQERPLRKMRFDAGATRLTVYCVAAH